MADVISRLRLDSGEFDSKIKRAGQELMAYSEHCRKMGLEMGYANRDAKEFAKALGNMQTTSSSARGKINELSEAFVNLKVMYKNMTDEERNNTFGKNLAASLDSLKTRINDAKKDLADVTAELNGKSSAGGGFLSGIGSKMEGALAVFGGNLMTKASEAVVRLGSEMYGMVQQGIEMARAGEGVRIAFERLGRGDLLDGLRQATHGTVTDLELMKAAVKFNDFKLPVEELGTMLAFAQQKAKDTGQSVDYMVDSIVTGLGRKSLMILDNLGLSAAEIKERMKETGDMTKAVGAIIRDQMAKAGDYVETAADRATKADVALKNAMEELGRTFQPLTDAGTSMWTTLETGALKFLSSVGSVIAQLTEAGRIAKQYGNMGGSEKVGNMLNYLKTIKTDKYRQGTYKLQVGKFDERINSYQQYLDDYKAWNDKKSIAAYDRMKAFQQRTGLSMYSDVKEQMGVYQRMRAEYMQGASGILNPTKPVTTTTTDSKKKKEKELTELQQNQQKINDLTQEYVKLGDESTEAARERQAEIQKEITLLEKRNGLLGLRAEQAQGRLLSNEDMKRKAEIDIQVNTKQIEDLRKQLTEIEGVTIDPKTFEVTANTSEAQQKVNELKAKIAELEDKNINIKAFVESIGKPLGDGLSNTPGTLLKAPETSIPSGGLQLDDKAMNAVQKNISKQLKDVDGLADKWGSVSSAISAVGNAMAAVEDPAAKVLGIVAQAIATVALTFSKSLAGTVTPWDWIAAAAAGTATMISTISAIHSATGYAEGGMIKGNSYSGDNLMAMGPNGALIGLNAGEIVLNKSQQNNLASQLQGNPMSGMNLTATIKGEQIRLALNNNGRRTGRGEYVQSRNVR